MERRSYESRMGTSTENEKPNPNLSLLLEDAGDITDLDDQRDFFNKHDTYLRSGEIAEDFSKLSLQDQWETIRRMSRSPELGTFFGADRVMLAFAGELIREGKRIDSLLTSQNLEERVELIFLTRSLLDALGDTAASGRGAYFQARLKHLALLKGYRTDEHPIIRVAAIGALGGFAMEGSEHVYGENSLRPNLWEPAIHLENKKMQSQVAPSDRSVRIDYMARVSRDAIAGVDDTGYVQALGRYQDQNEVDFFPFGSFLDRRESGEGVSYGGGHVLREFMRPVLREGLKKEMHVDLCELSLREQIELFKYLNTSTPEEAEAVFANAREYGIPYLQTFLVAERQPEVVATIQTLARGEDKEGARSIFQTYGEIVLAIDKEAEVMIREKMKDSSTIDTELLRKRVNEELLQKAGTFFKEASRAVLSGNQYQLEGIFNAYKKESLLFCGLFKSAFEIGGEAVIDQLRGVELYSCGSNDPFLDSERGAIEKMIKRNWDEHESVIQKDVLENYRKAADPTSGAKFYLLKKDGSLIGLIRFNEIEALGERMVQVGSFNVDRSLQGSMIGTAFLERTLGIESADKPLYATTVMEDAISSAYVKRFGFVFRGVHFLEGGMIEAKMVRDHRLNAERVIEKKDRKSFRIDLVKNREDLIHLLERCEHDDLMITKFDRVSGSSTLRDVTVEPIYSFAKSQRKE